METSDNACHRRLRTSVTNPDADLGIAASISDPELFPEPADQLHQERRSSIGLAGLLVALMGVALRGPSPPVDPDAADGS